jgi:hypothetical protein
MALRPEHSPPNLNLLLCRSGSKLSATICVGDVAYPMSESPDVGHPTPGWLGLDFMTENTFIIFPPSALFALL